jgi:hypothetical protein
VDIDGTSEHGRFIVKTITVDGDDLETSEMIEAGWHPTAQQVDANMRAIEGNRQHISTNKEEIEAPKKQVAGHTANPARFTSRRLWKPSGPSKRTGTGSVRWQIMT